MPRVTRAAAHLSVEEVKRRMQTAPHPLWRQRWLLIYNAQVDPRPAEAIATHCGVSKAVVQKAHFHLQSLRGDRRRDRGQRRPLS